MRKTVERTAMRSHLLSIAAALFLVLPIQAKAGVEVVDTEASLDLEESWTGDLDQMIERGAIRGLVVYNPTQYFIDRGNQHGISYEMLTLFERYVNENLAPGDRPVTVYFEPVRRDELFEAIEKGRGDLVVANVTITPERLELVDFSEPFRTGVSEILVTGPSSPAIDSLDDLAGRDIHVRPSSSYAASLEQLNTDFEARGLDPVNIVPVHEALEDVDILDMVHAGLLPYAVVDDHKAQHWVDLLDNITPRPDLAIRTGADIGWAMRKNSPQLAKAVNSFLGDHRKGTLVGNVVVKRYLEDSDRLDNVFASSEDEEFRNKAALFAEYAAQYDFDHLLLLAQGYQESKLDQSARSSTGAVGVMQILPTTAADKNVDIADIDQLENNIHAGSKYLRFIKDRYFSDIEDPFNRTMFAMAAYNAGPAAITRLRTKTTENGGNANVWFDGVEHAAARHISREPVTYVRNILKYYTAYKLAAERRAERLQAANEVVQETILVD